MPTPEQIQKAIANVHDQQSFIQELLADCLGWRFRADIPLEESLFEWNASELREGGLEQSDRVWQIRPFNDSQPWGIFIFELNREDVFFTGRGLTGTLRKALKGLAPSRRRAPDLPAWRRENLLFVATYKYRHFRFAFFKAPESGRKAPPLAHFGWQQGDTHVRTLCQYNLPSLEYPEDSRDSAEWLSRWAGAFDLERVTKKFFEDYREVFEAVEALATEVPSGEKRRLTQRLFNRLMFLYFIQKKGWLTFEGSRNYLRALFNAAEANDEDFLNHRLYALFFQGLNVRRDDLNQRDRRLVENLCGVVPYLNGGLFSLIDDYDCHGAVKIPNSAFAAILGLFERYNFTITESTPLDIEVAVDPEMLGKVFEELVTGRHDTGSYYTPRPVVAFMCREALKGYLASETGAAKEAIAAMVDDDDVTKINESQARKVLDALDSLKAVDPACGSGAYLLGLLHEMVRLYRLLYSERLIRDARSLYELKQRIITNNVYGVDIDEFAVSIARLRLWLSLAVDSDDPLPLPNLDFKIEVGDSILAADPSSTTRGNLFQHGQILKFEELKAQFTDAFYKGDKATLRAEIGQLREKIAEVMHLNHQRGRFDWRLDFAEAWDEKDGFDIVLANPPYVRQELIGDMKPMLEGIYPQVYTGMADLYCYFYARAIQLLRPNGMLAFISSSKWFRASYGKKLRRYIGDLCSAVSITDFGDLPVFDCATAYPMIFVARKNTIPPSEPREGALFTQVKSLESPYPDVQALTSAFGTVLSPDATSGENWGLIDVEVHRMLNRMKQMGIPLGEYVHGRFFRGLVTGYNDAFIIDGSTRSELIAEDPHSMDIIKPLAVGDDIRKWHIRDSDRWLIYSPWDFRLGSYPSIRTHLSRFREALEARPECRSGRFNWWCMSRYGAEFASFFQEPKIIYPVITKEPRFCYDTRGTVTNDKAFIIPTSDTYLLGVLNSAPVWIYLKSTCSNLRGGYVELRSVYMEKLPIPVASSEDKDRIESLVQRCLDARGENCDEWEREIDERVARLYGLGKTT